MLIERLTEEQRKIFDVFEEKVRFDHHKGAHRLSIKFHEKNLKEYEKIPKMLGGKLNGPYEGMFLWVLRGKHIEKYHEAFTEFLIDRRQEYIDFMKSKAE